MVIMTLVWPSRWVTTGMGTPWSTSTTTVPEAALPCWVSVSDPCALLGDRVGCHEGLRRQLQPRAEVCEPGAVAPSVEEQLERDVRLSSLSPLDHLLYDPDAVLGERICECGVVPVRILDLDAERGQCCYGEPACPVPGDDVYHPTGFRSREMGLVIMIVTGHHVDARLVGRARNEARREGPADTCDG